MKDQYPIKQAIITGVVSALFAIGSFSLIESLNHGLNWGFKPANVRGIIGLLSLIILGVGIFTSMQSIKCENDGRLTYGKSVISGMIVALVTAVCMAMFGLIYNTIINPGASAYILEETRKVMIAEGDSAVNITTNINALKRELTIQAQLIEALVGQFVSGTIISLIMGLFVRTK